MSELYEFRMSLFDHGKPEEFVLFVQNFQMNLAASGMLETEEKVNYICTLVSGGSLCQFDVLYAYVENTDIFLTVDYLLKSLAWYFTPMNSISKQKRAMRRCMKKPSGLKVSRYATHLIDLNYYLASFTGATMDYKIGVTELNVILLNST